MTQKHTKDIFVLGVHDGHTAGAAIIKNGKVIAAISEERLTNNKNQSGTPVLSIAKVFDIAGITPGEVALAAISSRIRVTPDPGRVNDSLLFQVHMRLAPYFRDDRLIDWAVRFLSHLPLRRDTLKALSDIGIPRSKITYIEHHLGHAAAAYYSRPWSHKTLIFTLDGMGDGLSATVNVGSGSTIRRIAKSSYYDSLGNNLYSEMASYMGMKRCEHEYKLMGLAPYGDPAMTEEIFQSIIRINPDKPLVFENISGAYLADLQALYRLRLAHKRFDHVAAGVQKVFEDLVISWVKNAIAATGVSRIACAGGAFLNVKANKLIRDLPDVTDSFFYPAADDGGLAVGAALAGYSEYCRNNKLRTSPVPVGDIYYGQSFTTEFIRERLKFKRIPERKILPADEAIVARMLSEGKIIARFSGRDEWGPRALGNRSIMADPRNGNIIHKINFSIKQRDFWMPFAPAILAEDQKRYLVKSRFAPYMIEAFDTTNEANEIEAALHPFDRTARPQTVNDWNPGWQRLIREFKKQTGVGAVLNTSYNLHGYPLVSTPDQAIWTFRNSKLDGLLFDNLLITR
jgi:carbamoyltransferase